ncbi:unnamed protein product, partial [Choristocarpus tenellus]
MSSTNTFERTPEQTYGTVFKAKVTATGSYVALKRVKLQDLDEGVPPTTMRRAYRVRI